MKSRAYFLLTLCVCGLVSVVPNRAAGAGESTKEMRDEIFRLVSNNDMLGARVLVFRMSRMAMDARQWREIRELLLRDRRVGWDAIRRWDQADPVANRQQKIDVVLEAADKLMQERNFEAAFISYQKVARALKTEMSRGNAQNSDLYLSILHDMAQALYGAGRFKDSFTVYEWIPATYPAYREVLFERMWAAFRVGRIDAANGAIASQYSTYFGEILEPEAYLVQIYLYKKMCRGSDLRLVLRRIDSLRQRLENGAITLGDWARTDFQARVLLPLAAQREQTTSSLVSIEERDSERVRIQGAVQVRFEKSRKRLLTELDRARAFADLAFASTSRDLPLIRKLPSNEELLRSGLEMWPVESGEDWVDELGHHVFIGESQCGKSSSR